MLAFLSVRSARQITQLFLVMRIFMLHLRQFSVASSLYSGEIDEIKSMVRILSSRIEHLLRSNRAFDQSDVAVSSRVKEPYSLWKKMIRYRKDIADAKNRAAEGGSDMDDAQRCGILPTTLSLRWVPDAIAFRVVLRALRLSPLEDDESLRTREKMLCYYALRLISDVWPASARNEAKDYIANPKPNGYQSLHYTASLMVGGEEWPFEVQVPTYVSFHSTSRTPQLQLLNSYYHDTYRYAARKCIGLQSSEWPPTGTTNFKIR